MTGFGGYDLAAGSVRTIRPDGTAGDIDALGNKPLARQAAGAFHGPSTGAFHRPVIGGSIMPFVIGALAALVVGTATLGSTSGAAVAFVIVTSWVYLLLPVLALNFVDV